jgi:hypothetical protein
MVLMSLLMVDQVDLGRVVKYARPELSFVN